MLLDEVAVHETNVSQAPPVLSAHSRHWGLIMGLYLMSPVCVFKVGATALAQNNGGRLWLLERMLGTTRIQLFRVGPSSHVRVFSSLYSFSFLFF